MKTPTSPRPRHPVVHALAVIGLSAATVVAVAGASIHEGRGPEPAPDHTAVALEPAPAPTIPDSLFGLSGKLRTRFLVAPAVKGSSLLAFPSAPGVYSVPETMAGRPFSFIVLVPFAEKTKGRLGSYRMGYWPAEQGHVATEAYDNPEGFIRVTPENQNTYVSEHFQLKDFLTKDQRDVWPKYLVLREALLDKLELVIADLESHGIPVNHMHVMSGFRTPQYNEQGVASGGRAQLSRHQYGDAADVFVDNDRDGWIDDLNGDGRKDTRDAEVLVDAVGRVERSYPDLLGGAGLYTATEAHGPFTHIDTRGRRARWGTALASGG